MTAVRQGVLLLNLGTPEAPEAEAVARYLKQFLMDKWVVDVPAPLRWFFVHALIVPKRKFTSAEAYRKIWTESGSPLLVITRELTERLRERLSEIPVAMAMRYGQPSVRVALEELRECEEIIVLPLYPQYAESSTRSSHEECQRQAADLGWRGRFRFVPSFYADPGFIAAFAERIRAVLENERPDHVLFSYHGLPERQVTRLDPTGSHCRASATCCDRIVEANKLCYRAHCFETTRLLAAALALEPDHYSVSFQSRLGRAAWIPPFTETKLEELARAGVRRLAVVCPSFVADCLETIEEIGMRATEIFQRAGGTSLYRVPCVNADPKWVEAVESLVRRSTAQS